MRRLRIIQAADRARQAIAHSALGCAVVTGVMAASSASQAVSQMANWMISSRKPRRWAGREWAFEPRRPVETVCHNELFPWNTVFRSGVPVAFIDWDTAAPGPRVWDLKIGRAHV